MRETLPEFGNVNIRSLVEVSLKATVVFGYFFLPQGVV